MVTRIAAMATTEQTHVPVHEAKAKFSEMIRRVGEGEEIVKALRDVATVAVNHGHRGSMEAHRSAVVAEAIPTSDQLGLAGRGRCSRIREVSEEGDPQTYVRLWRAWDLLACAAPLACARAAP